MADPLIDADAKALLGDAGTGAAVGGSQMIDKGVWIQPYLAKVDRRFLDDKLRDLAELGVTGILWHWTSTRDAVQEFAEYADRANHAIPLLSAAAFGMGDTDAEEKGQNIAKVAAMRDCQFVALDCEGSWENEPDDKAKARALVGALRAAAAHAVVVDQPWFAPLVHSSFPWEEFSAAVDEHCPQVYVNDFMRDFGKARYRKVWDRYEREWKVLDTRLAAKHMGRPRFPTIQGYGWSDILPDLVDCLCRNSTVLVWCEPWPDVTTMLALRIVQALGKLGFAKATAVSEFQSAHGLVADGICGPLTLAALKLISP